MMSSPVTRPETTTRPSVWRLRGAKTAIAIAKPSHMASPPRGGVGRLWAWRPPGWAIRPRRGETRIAMGVASTQTTKARRSGHSPGRRWSVMLASAWLLKKSVKCVRDREASTELERPLVHRIERRAVVDALDEVGDAVRYHDHLGFTHAAGCDQRCSDPHPARVELRRVIERDGVAVERDADRVRDVLHLLARALLLSQVDEHQMVVGPAAHEPKATLGQPVGHRFRVHHDLFRIALEIWLQRFAEANRLGRDRVHQRAALRAWKDRGVDRFLPVVAAKDDRAPRPPTRLLRRG